MWQQLPRVDVPVAALSEFEKTWNDGHDDEESSFLLNDDIFEISETEDSTPSEMAAAVGQGIQNPLVIKEIIKNLTARDLLTCRLINSCWNELATKILKDRRPTPAVTFWLSLCPAQYDRYTQNGTRTLKIFNQIFLKSPTTTTNTTTFHHELPFANFNLNNVSLNSDPDLEEFFTLFGTRVKALRMSLINTDIQGFAKLLQNRVPNLQSLHIEKFPPEWEKNDSINLQVFNPVSKNLEKLHLPKLQTFKFDGRLSNYPEIVREILSAATNLKNFNSLLRGSDMHQLKIFKDTGKFHTIQNLQFEPTAMNLDFYENFLNFHAPTAIPLPKLTKCLFSLRSLNRQPNCWPQAAEMMSQILKIGAPTLQEIGLVHPMPLTFSRLVEWRRMEKVRKIEISIFTTGGILEDKNGILEKPSFLWSKIFPNLDCLALVPIVNKKHFWDRHIPFKGPALSVSRLEVHFPSPEFCLENLHQIFPNVTHLLMKRVTDFPRVGRAIWSFKKLKNIELQLDVDFQAGNGNVYPAVDAIFTGFSQETCKRLKYSRSPGEDPQIVDNLRVNPSLLDLQCLENLTIELCYWTPFSSSSRSVQDSYNLMTNVTGIYAFQAMPQLTVDVTATSLFCEQNLRHIKESLASIAPFVNKLETSSIKPAPKPKTSRLNLSGDSIRQFCIKIWQSMTNNLDGHNFVKYLVTFSIIILMVAFVLKYLLL